MEATEIHETVSELQEGEEHGDAHSRQGVAIYISILAVIMAITTMGGGNATKDMMNANIIASDTYSFYQAKSIRQTDFRLAADELLALKQASNWLPNEAAKFIDERVKGYNTAIEKYESDPKTGEGKKELMAKAHQFEAIRDHAAQQDPYFDYAEALIQISIVLASVSIVARRRWVLFLSYLFAGVGVTLLVDGFTLLVDLL